MGGSTKWIQDKIIHLRTWVADIGGICWWLAWDPRSWWLAVLTNSGYGPRRFIYVIQHWPLSRPSCPFIICSLWKSTDEQPPTAPRTQTSLKFYKLGDAHILILKPTSSDIKNTGQESFQVKDATSYFWSHLISKHSNLSGCWIFRWIVHHQELSHGNSVNADLLQHFQLSHVLCAVSEPDLQQAACNDTGKTTLPFVFHLLLGSLQSILKRV